ncbi:aldose epimerase family protein [Sphingomonas sp.]|jgi:aldose 1-epimerase|uniref:aldose epimerase family protein n=1 Tax=Sphingomonas sp. TaxID=28214 RepID=UPI002ED7EC91
MNGTVTLTNANGVSATILAIGATLQALRVPDRHGMLDDVVLGHDTPEEYLASRNFFGSTVGRYANRIAEGRFTLDRRGYALTTNDGANHLHGGTAGLDQRVWEVRSATSSSVTLSCRSPDGEDGYPGALEITATYTLSDANELTIDYQATTDAPTIVNITNHAYFNLAGADRDAMGHRLTIHASHYTPVDETLIPTGALDSVADTPFDFREGAAIGARVRDARDPQIRVGLGYDHNYVLDGEAGTLRPAARLEDPVSGRVMEMLVTAPGLQFYSGNFLDGKVIGKRGRAYRQGDGIALEPQLFPDSPNRPEFPSARLDPGEVYRNTIVLRFSVSD